MVNPKENDFAILFLETIHFEIGREGQLCMIEIGAPIDSLICFLRPVEFIFIRRIISNPSRPFVDIEFKLRGNVFGDFLAARNMTIPLTIANPSFDAEELFRDRPKNGTINLDLDCKTIVYRMD
jgi:hypothetical protein